MSKVLGKTEEAKVKIPDNQIKQIKIYYVNGVVDTIDFLSDGKIRREVMH